MDLLGSILNAMDKPPAPNEKQKEAFKKHSQEVEKIRNHQKDELMRFRKYAEERLDRLGRDSNRTFMQFQPLDKMYRTVVHDIAELGGFMAISFGQEDVDRYIVVYKRDNPPSEDEVAARRDGLEWNEEKAREYKENRAKQQRIDEDNAQLSEVVAPTSNYKDKYVHLIGQEAALEAARKTESNKSYGIVPSKNKKDIRSIEQTMADIQAKKRLKTSHCSDSTGTLEEISPKELPKPSSSVQIPAMDLPEPSSSIQMRNNVISSSATNDIQTKDVEH